MDDLFDAIRWHLFQDLLVQQERESKLGEIMTDENTEELCRAFGVSPNTYEELPSGKRLYGSRDPLPEWYAQACHDYAMGKKENASSQYDIPGGPTFRYTSGNDFLYIGDSPISITERDGLVAWLQSLTFSSTPPPLTGAGGYQAPTSGNEGVPVTNRGVYMTQGPAMQALEEQQRQDRERTIKRFAEASFKAYPRLDNRTKR